MWKVLELEVREEVDAKGWSAQLSQPPAEGLGVTLISSKSTSQENLAGTPQETEGVSCSPLPPGEKWGED